MARLKFYTIYIALALIIIFTIQAFSQGFTDLFILNKSAFTQPWRFVTAIFLHGSLSHLMYNLFALIIFGLILEKLVGSSKFLLIYLVSGILANLVSIYFYPSSLGASGAIMGIIGALTIIRPLMTVWAFGMIMPMAVAALLWVIGDAIGIFMPDNVGHIAHLSGIGFGIIFGIFLRLKHKKTTKTHMVEVPEHMLRRWETLYMGGN